MSEFVAVQAQSADLCPARGAAGDHQRARGHGLRRRDRRPRLAIAAHVHEDAVVEAARDAVALMGTSIRHTPISRRIMQASQRLRVVAKYTVGVDDIDVEAATDLGVMVCHAPTESNCFGVAETTVTFMLSLLKKVAERDADVRAGKWRTPENFAYYVGSRALRRLCRPDHRPRRARAHRHAGGPVAGALARAHHRLRPLRAAGAFPHPRRHSRSITRHCCGSPTSCRSTSC